MLIYMKKNDPKKGKNDQKMPNIAVVLIKKISLIGEHV